MCEFAQYALSVPRILLPGRDADMRKWAVIACDQFSSEPGYWDDVEKQVSGAPSTYNIIFPECYLGEPEGRIGRINDAMAHYRRDVLTRAVDGFVIVERETIAGKRLGLVAAVDLDQYDYQKGSKSLIRPTEGTIEDRLPPRVAIRKDAVLESPHIMMLVDDPGKLLIEPLFETHKGDAPLYDFELMSGGRIRGFAADTPEDFASALHALTALHAAADGLLFAVGDGNHSLATAKRCWEMRKNALSAEQRLTDPARFALVEICNVHDPAMAFEPIHRAIFGANRTELAHDFAKYSVRNGIVVAPCAEDQAEMFLMDAPVRLENAVNPLPLTTLQPFLDEWLRLHPDCSIDYIHGADALDALAEKGACCIRLSSIDKFALFESVRKGGALPRKTFSLGEATDKRYYLECRGL